LTALFFPFTPTYRLTFLVFISPPQSPWLQTCSFYLQDNYYYNFK